MGAREEGGNTRRSKDKKVNKEGKMLVEFLGKKGWGILNGGTVGDEEGEYTFTGGKGNLVIDYVIGEKGIRKNVERVYIREKIDSDHHLVKIWIKGKGGKERKVEERKRLKAGGWYERRRGRESLKGG